MATRTHRPSILPLRVAVTAALVLAAPGVATGQEQSGSAATPQGPTAGATPTAPPGAAPSPQLSPEALATRALHEVMRLLVKKKRLMPREAEMLVPADAGSSAVEELARYLQVRGVLTPTQLDEMVDAIAAGEPGAGPRAVTEVIRLLFEKGELTDGELEALVSPEGVRRITYVPELVRVQLREQLRKELLDQMKREG